MNFDSTSEFDRELKVFLKKWPSLLTDFNPVKKSLPLLYSQQPGESAVDLQLRRDQFFNNKRATILHPLDGGREVVKMRLDCASLGSKDVLRLVFVYVLDGNTIRFIELYSKTDKKREDAARVKKYR